VERLEKVFPGRKLKAERQGHSAFGLARRFAAYPVVRLHGIVVSLVENQAGIGEPLTRSPVTVAGTNAHCAGHRYRTTQFIPER
jgi:hypothetical protein